MRRHVPKIWDATARVPPMAIDAQPQFAADLAEDSLLQILTPPKPVAAGIESCRYQCCDHLPSAVVRRTRRLG